MSQIRTALLLTVAFAALSLGGCGDTNPKVSFSPDSGKHVTGWATGHKTLAKADKESCFECHGENLDGGIANVSCTQCHLGSNGSIHPDQWGQYAYARHKSYVAVNGTASCANGACHGGTLAGVPGSGPACATACHMGNPLLKHPAGWTATSHAGYVKASGNGKCSTATCHGTDGKGVFLSGPSCTQCHLGGILLVHPAVADWKNTGHKLYTLTGLTVEQTRAKCDIAACHGSFNDASKPGQIKVDKTCGVSCHAGDKN